MGVWCRPVRRIGGILSVLLLATSFVSVVLGASDDTNLPVSSEIPAPTNVPMSTADDTINDVGDVDEFVNSLVSMMQPGQKSVNQDLVGILGGMLENMKHNGAMEGFGKPLYMPQTNYDDNGDALNPGMQNENMPEIADILNDALNPDMNSLEMADILKDALNPGMKNENMPEFVDVLNAATVVVAAVLQSFERDHLRQQSPPPVEIAVKEDQVLEENQIEKQLKLSQSETEEALELLRGAMGGAKKSRRAKKYKNKE